MSELIQVKKVSKVYTTGEVRTEALSKVSFTIVKGEFVSIVGPSGSGKSTLMHILGCLDLPTSGTYTINGRNIESMDDDELADIRNKEIGFVFQAYNLLPRTSAIKNVVLPLAYAGIPRSEREEKARQMLNLVDLESRMDNYPNQLSGGEKQRVAIARALSTNPSILLADEPTGNLASKQSEEIISIFEELNKKGHTVIIITHEDHIADKTRRKITLRDGKIISDERREKV